MARWVYDKEGVGSIIKEDIIPDGYFKSPVAAKEALDIAPKVTVKKKKKVNAG